MLCPSILLPLTFNAAGVVGLDFESPAAVAGYRPEDNVVAPESMVSLGFNVLASSRHCIEVRIASNTERVEGYASPDSLVRIALADFIHTAIYKNLSIEEDRRFAFLGRSPERDQDCCG
jgi:hypothetical protein